MSGYLGIDTRTKGLAVYRLLDAIVTFHDRLPAPGDVIRYDIAIDGFVPARRHLAVLLSASTRR